MDDPLEMVRALRKRVEELAESLNLKLVDFGISPSSDGIHPDTLVAAFAITAESLKEPEELVRLKAEREAFAAIEANFAIDKEKDALEEIRIKQAAMKDALGEWLDGD